MTQCGVHGSMEYVKQLEAERDALRARIDDVEGMAKFMCELSYPATGTGWAGTVESARMAWRERARAVSAWLKEGK